jgi:HK97 family phage portal protein
MIAGALTGRVPAPVPGPAARTVPGQAVVLRDDPLPDEVRAALEAEAAERAGDLAALEIVARQRTALAGSGAATVTQDTALRHSAVWACLRLRANLISTTPLDAFRRVGGMQLEVVKPALLEEPTPGVDITEHLYSSQVDLDRYGNSVAVIKGRNALGQPLALDLAPMGDTRGWMKGNRLDHWRICGERYEVDEVWHERQYTVGGWPMGLSPIAYGAWSIGGYLSAQEFVQQWFIGGAAPSGVLRNTELQELDDTVIDNAKDRFKLATAGRDIFVTGSDWEWTPAAMDAASAGFLEERQYGVVDVARFMDVPADMIDASSSGSSITYANITQRNVQLLVINLGPAYTRRERFWSRRALPAPDRFVKFNTDALLRMDPQAREALILARVAGKTLAPSEARALNNLAPFTPAQLEELVTFGIIGAGQPAAPAGTGV